MVHLGKNLAKIRGFRMMTQKEVAALANISQSEYSRLEQSQEISDEILQKIATVLEVDLQSIKELDDKGSINILSSSFHDNASVNNQSSLTFNPVEKLMEIVDENRKLYERIIADKDQIIEMYKKQQQAS